ncbi:uncharacterized protein LOC119671891 [Teleopsis dalmanni]|uniref:uncharacterized protein LOC119670631 n=1 Tax=Teleopsis dalmanni TaxID=139649 RepID=UPI000D329E3A|nr:uncharacterized protein LOC119670631 [Teleopsis dalmanni]XP_037936893.1 uncharacterized protein LOC119670631 [Teleopsis dalmanni]XP_037936894.1 uncharacterized protein LOC119670631 [Teleopsis dalmanni]XP_037938670.1 uncharacterized protein LOC119671891 [Teleopsis dalmanni]XP_037938679.1 uncharacterized protein LOC119671891 [Teleopsis dalmanni]
MARCKKERKKKCARPGPITNNPFFNFLREMRKNGCTTDIIETAKCGAKLWSKLSEAEKKKYCSENIKKKNAQSSCQKPVKKLSCVQKRPKKRKNPCVKPKKKPSACAPKKKPTKLTCRLSSAPRKCNVRKKKKNKCMKIGPPTSNPYLNYLRYFKQRNCGLKPREVVKRAARCWCRLPPDKKRKYKLQACKVTTSARRKATKLCRSVLAGARSKGRKC